MIYIVKVRFPDNSGGQSSLFTDKAEADEYAAWLRSLPEYDECQISVVVR